MEDDDFEHKTIDEVLESEQKKKKKQKLLEKVRISYFITTPFFTTVMYGLWWHHVLRGGMGGFKVI